MRKLLFKVIRNDKSYKQVQPDILNGAVAIWGLWLAFAPSWKPGLRPGACDPIEDCCMRMAAAYLKMIDSATVDESVTITVVNSLKEVVSLLPDEGLQQRMVDIGFKFAKQENLSKVTNELNSVQSEVSIQSVKQLTDSVLKSGVS